MQQSFESTVLYRIFFSMLPTDGVASTIKSEAQDCAGYVLSIILNRVVAKKDAPKDALRENKVRPFCV